MPGQDKTGPMGFGPLTGRGFGPCGCGLRRGLGGGFRFRRITSQEEKESLKQELEEVKAEQKAIEERLKELE